MAVKNEHRRVSNIIGFDDAPFPKGHTGTVKVVGTVYARHKLNGILVGEVERDGSDAAEKLVTLVSESKFAQQVQLIMLQGIALGGFNVIDVFSMHEQLMVPLLVVSRNFPDMQKIKDALFANVPGSDKKWDIIERLGPMEPVEKVYVQRVGLSLDQAAGVIKQFTINGHIPEPLRVAHLIAGAIVDGQSRGRV